ENQWEIPEIVWDDVAFLQYTSGSTSAPKGVMVTHGNLLSNEKWIRMAAGNHEKTVTVSWLPLFHDLGLIGMMIHSMYLGGKCILMSPMAFIQKPVRWLNALSKYQGNYTAAPNFAYDLCARKVTQEQKQALDLSHWKVAMNAAEPVNAETLELFAEAFKPCGYQPEVMCPWYGLAEGTLIVSAGSPNDLPIIKTVDSVALELRQFIEVESIHQQARQVVACGVVGVDDEMVIVDPDSLTLSPAGHIGEVWVKGPSVAVGYWNRPEATIESLQAKLDGKGDYLRTGDLGFIIDDDLYVSGRIKDLVIIRGQNFYPQDIEWSVERTHPAFRIAGNAAFTIVKNDEEQLIIVQEIERLGLKKLNVDEAFHAINRIVLEQHGIPVHSIILIRPMTIPKTSSGKIQRHACKIAYRENTFTEVARWQAPIEEDSNNNSDNIQDWLIHRFCYYAKLDEEMIDIEQDVIHHILDSMSAMSLVDDIESKLNQQQSLNILWDYETIASLSIYLQEQDNNAEHVSSKLIYPVLNKDSKNQFESFPLNDIQQAYWFGRQSHFELGNVACHLYFEMQCQELDVKQFQIALNQVIQRHAMLRCVIQVDGSQRILQQVDNYEIPIIHVENQVQHIIDNSLQEQRNRLSAQVRNTEQWPLFDVVIHQLPESFKIHFSFDLLIADLWSIQRFFDEWKTLYQNTDTTLPEIDLSFRDYVLTESQFKQTELFDKAWNYWQQKIIDLPAAPDLPLLQDPAKIHQPIFKRHQMVIVKKTWQELKQLAQVADLTESMLICAIFSEILSCWSRSNQFTLNVTLFNRLPVHPQVNDLIGDFTTLELLGVSQNYSISFIERARALQRQLLDDLQYRHVNGLHVLKEWSKIHSKNATMPVVFTSALPIQDAQQSEIFPTDWLGERVYSVSQTPQVWLDHQVYEEQGDLHLSWDVVESLFPEQMIETMFEAYQSLLTELANDGDLWYQTQLPIIPAFQQIVIDASNDVHQAVPTGLLQSAFFQYANCTPNSIAIIQKNLRLSYAGIADISHKIANLLQQTIVSDEKDSYVSRVAIVMEKGWEQSVACLGILQAGCAYVPVDPSLPAERLNFILQNIDCQIVLTQKQVNEKIDWPDFVT
ncbi:MAG: AMP-binding protein, partial [Methylococcales bacterium]|nr:AMP-binding protein [Methylococcales bacterium]